MYKLKKLVLTALVCLNFITLFSQLTSVNQILGSGNKITLVVPFLTISPDARGSGLGDCGVATSADISSIFYNPAKITFSEKSTATGLTFTPWLRALVPDLSLTHFSIYSQLNKKSAIAMSMRYFALGNSEFNEDFGASLGEQKPYQFTLDGAYSRKLSENFSMGISLRFIHSNLVPNLPSVGTVTVKPGVSGSGDLSAYYLNNTRLAGNKTTYAFGINLQNIGSKISYTNALQKALLPATLRLGASTEMFFNKDHSIMLTVEMTRLLVPVILASQVQVNNWCGVRDSIPEPDQLVIDDDAGVFEGMLLSFHDSPDGFKGEIKEFNWSLGAEYSFKKQLMIRSGYFHECPAIGNRSYFTVGAGLRYKHAGIDISYLLPQNMQSPLKNTFRFGLSFEFDGLKKK